MFGDILPTERYNMERTQVNSLVLASHIMKVCEDLGYIWNNTKIQKLMYIVYGVILAARDYRICDEYPRAWQYGPAFPRVVKAINKNKIQAEKSLLLDEEQQDVIVKIVNEFGKYTATELSAWSHKKGSPWDLVVNENEGMNSFIPDDFIKVYFKENVIA